MQEIDVQYTYTLLLITLSKIGLSQTKGFCSDTFLPDTAK